VSKAELAAWVMVALNLAAGLAVFAGRHWLQARIEKGVQHQFDVKLDKLRAELQAKENEISALRNAVLTGSANRQAMLDKRRFEAVETVWSTIRDLDRFKPLSSMMAMLSFKKLAAKNSDLKIQQFLSTIRTMAPDIKTFQNKGRAEQPYLPALAWAYFSAYVTVILGSIVQTEVLRSGVSDADQLLTFEETKKILKSALPHQSEFIDSSEPQSLHYLLDEIEAKLLEELRKILDGRTADHDAAEHAKSILDAIDEVNVDHDSKKLGLAELAM
jgi:hypothetical protein